jgi:hypothetical protein
MQVSAENGLQEIINEDRGRYTLSHASSRPENISLSLHDRETRCTPLLASNI